MTQFVPYPWMDLGCFQVLASINTVLIIYVSFCGYACVFISLEQIPGSGMAQSMVVNVQTFRQTVKGWEMQLGVEHLLSMYETCLQSPALKHKINAGLEVQIAQQTTIAQQAQGPGSNVQNQKEKKISSIPNRSVLPIPAILMIIFYNFYLHLSDDQGF